MRSCTYYSHRLESLSSSLFYKTCKRRIVQVVMEHTRSGDTVDLGFGGVGCRIQAFRYWKSCRPQSLKTSICSTGYLWGATEDNSPSRSSWCRQNQQMPRAQKQILTLGGLRQGVGFRRVQSLFESFGVEGV